MFTISPLFEIIIDFNEDNVEKILFLDNISMLGFIIGFFFFQLSFELFWSGKITGTTFLISRFLLIFTVPTNFFLSLLNYQTYNSFFQDIERFLTFFEFIGEIFVAFAVFIIIIK